MFKDKVQFTALSFIRLMLILSLKDKIPHKVAVTDNYLL